MPEISYCPSSTSILPVPTRAHLASSALTASRDFSPMTPLQRELLALLADSHNRFLNPDYCLGNIVVNSEIKL